MFEKFLNIFRVPDLRRRVLFTLGILAVYRLGAHITTPGVNVAALESFFNNQAGSSLGLVDLFSGGNLRRLTIFALGIMPYITASIIFQLLTVVYEPLAKLQKEGELGRRKITQWTRYVTVILGIVQSAAIAIALRSSSGNLVLDPGFGFIAMTVITLTAGTTFIMWLGEQITERGIGQRDEPADLRGHRGGAAARNHGSGSDGAVGAIWGIHGSAADPAGDPDGGDRGVHRICGTQRAADSSAVCEEDCGTAADGRAVDASAAEGELGRRDADYFCRVGIVGSDAVWAGSVL